MCVSVCVSPLLTSAWTNLYETSYVYRGTWTHVNGIIKNPSHQFLCLYVYPLSLLGNGSVKISLSLLANGSVETLPR
jgi:hypothetical protein